MGGCLFKEVKVATSFTPILLMPMMLFSGFYSNLGTAASWIAWI